MGIFGYSLSLKLTIKRKNQRDPYGIESSIQKKILGSSSQYLEDIFIDRIFRGKKKGLYVDVGANDPHELSNTKRFYDSGWSGINIEPDLKMYELICRARPRDINLNVGIGAGPDELIFYELSPNTLSTFNKKCAIDSVKKNSASLIAEKKIQVITLTEVFKESAQGQQIDFLSVDSEGYEYEILASNNWQLYRPTAIIVEVNQDKEIKVLNLLNEQSYVMTYYNGTNAIFVDERSPLIREYLQ
jgi:FkbM family methyltransferase